MAGKRVVWCVALCALLSLTAQPVSGQVTRVTLQGGAQVSSIIYGTLHLAETQNAQGALQRIQQCLSVGITTFDLADVYAGGKALSLFGQALALKPSLRSSIQVIAKMDIGAQGAYIDTSVSHILSVVDLYLRTLNTNYLDMVLFHWPDPLMDLSTLVPLLQELTTNGTIKNVGVSNFNPYQFDLLQSAMPYVRLVANEIEISVLSPEAISNGMLDYLAKQGVPAFAWGPIGGDPFGGYNRLIYGDEPRERLIRGALQSFASELNTTLDVLAVAWLLRIPRKIIPIIGTTQLDRISNQSLAPSVAANMTRPMWWQIATTAGVPIFGKYSPLP